MERLTLYEKSIYLLIKLNEVTMTAFEQKVEDLKQKIVSRVNETGFYKWETCDTMCYGWDQQEHYASNALQNKGIEGINISCKVNWGVVDWVATIKI
jgi:hypothetical protein